MFDSVWDFDLFCYFYVCFDGGIDLLFELWFVLGYVCWLLFADHVV